MDTKSQVELMAIETHQNCSYCSSEEGSAESWLQSSYIEPTHYQMLLDRGWRRIGFYICKPIIDKSCCRQYAIRSDALDYKVSKSQRKVLKKMSRYLMTEGNEEMEKWKSKERYRSAPGQKYGRSCKIDENLTPQDYALSMDSQDDDKSSSVDPPTVVGSVKSQKKVPRPGMGPDPKKPPCVKSKVRKKKNRPVSLKSKSVDLNTCSRYETLRSLIPHLNPSDEYKRNLQVSLVPAVEHDPYFRSTSRESFEVFKKFQTTVLKEDHSEWSFKKWARCFIDCPVPLDSSGTGPGYGNFHQQYILDGKIIAVGVITLIPEALVTEYFYYDPDYGFLSMGIYSAMNEICFMNELHHIDNRKRRYYIGAYTHSSPKMRYKIQFAPSELLCPDTYKWIPLKECLHFLETERPRLNPNSEEEEPNQNVQLRSSFDLDKLLVSYYWDNMRYRDFVRERYEAADFDSTQSDGECAVDYTRQEAERNEEHEILKEYVTLIGEECATSIPLKMPVALYPM